MRVGIMQPYFLPYLGYFSLIKHVDLFILLDDVQFIRHGWIERNRILKPAREDWQYIRIPLIKHSRKTLIKNIEVNNNENYGERILAQLQHYKKYAPYFSNIINLVEQSLCDESHNYITDLNLSLLRKLCSYLEIDTPIKKFSDLKLKIGEITGPGDWALNICKSLGNVTEYWNPIGGKNIFDVSKFDKNEISIVFHEILLQSYNQKNATFIEGLSIIDVVMFNDKAQVNSMLDKYDLS